MLNKNIMVAGFTKRTSFSAARVLLELGNTVLVSDTVRDPEKLGLLDELNKLGKTVDLLGRQDPGIIEEYDVDMILPSPGVPLDIPLIMEARRRGIEVIGDIELFFRYFPKNTYIAITGTDGKTTTTTLVHEIVKRELPALVGGNIGTAIFDLYHDMRPDSVVTLELSSFQLEEIVSFRPKISAVLNIAADHLDRYPSIDEYLLAKKNIFNNQSKGDVAVLNLDSPYYDQVAKGVLARIVTFSRRDPKADCYFDGEWVYLKGEKFVERSKIALNGIHNVENAMAAILMTGEAGVSGGGIRAALAEFKGLPHRLEFVRELEGVSYYNDSKSTTVNALEKALLSFDTPVLAIVGGRDKGLDFTLIRDLAAKKLKKLVVIGEASEKIERELAFRDTYRAKDMADAVRYCRDNAVSGEAVVLSPGCASFDMFRNYAERGETFKNLVNSL
ncbi:MAG: UDP-N-acetylmuramoylalanine--D-glutamate ligase [Spirochaetes bacterium GWF1_51_8]|nr:MAG: UDP-N-acetylmuramoylalanine--D-glutamate ligase [Spirochaetes bacterium GWF1_51_8]